MDKKWIVAAFTSLLPVVAIARQVQIQPPPDTVSCHDVVECRLTVSGLGLTRNPFTEVIVQAWFSTTNGEVMVHGFADDASGRLFKVRYLPEMPGIVRYRIVWSLGKKRHEFTGSFRAMPSSLAGVVEVSKAHPTHMQYRGNAQYYYWNSTTTYWLSGWRDNRIIYQSLERLAGYGINRIRVAINGRAHGGERWAEPTVQESPDFTLKLNPWVAARPESLDDPGFDVTRFNLPHWQRLDSILWKAKSLGIVVSLIFYVDGLDHACDPFKQSQMGGADEQRYYRYALARFAAFPNIMWDIANEYHLFRTPAWAEQMGSLIYREDPFKHIISVHGSSDFPFRKAPWAQVIMFQSWDECGGYDFILQSLKDQFATGMPKPVVNEEYGYEDTYPPWGCGATAAKEPNGRHAINRAQLAWEMAMAGGYQTTGETAAFGTGAGDDSGGGWINGRGNSQMTMLRYYQIMRSIFESVAWYRLQPANHLVSFGNMCLALPGDTYLVYTRAPHCRLQLPAGQHYRVTMVNPATGQHSPQPDADSDRDNGAWQYRRHLPEPTVFILQRKPAL